MTRIAALVLSSALAVGCAVDLDAPDPGDRLVLALEGSWTADERTDIQAALDSWREASSGLVTIELGSSSPDATLVRGSTPSGALWGTKRTERTMWINADAFAHDYPTWEHSVQAATAQLIGTMLGIPKHNGSEGVMSSTNPTENFTDADRAMCRAASYCY